MHSLMAHQVCYSCTGNTAQLYITMCSPRASTCLSLHLTHRRVMQFPVVQRTLLILLSIASARVCKVKVKANYTPAPPARTQKHTNLTHFCSLPSPTTYTPLPKLYTNLTYKSDSNTAKCPTWKLPNPRPASDGPTASAYVSLTSSRFS